MKLADIITETNDMRGTYAGTYFDINTVESIRDYITENKIPKPVNLSKLHTTLLYSRKFLPDYKAAGKYETPMIGTPTELVVWKTKGDDGSEPANCLVMKYECPDLVKRHQELMKTHGATYDYDEYNPHITLSYDIGDMDITTLPNVVEAIKQVVIGEEYGEDLHLDWAHQAHK